MTQNKGNKELEHRVNLLKQVGMGADLSEEEHAELAKLMITEQYNEGEAIFEEDSQARDIYLLEKGKVSIRVTHPSTPDREETLHQMHEGQIFGELALVDGSPRSATVRAEEKVIVQRFDYTQIMDLMDINPLLGYKVMRNIARIIANRVRNTNMMWRCTLIW